MPCLRCFNGAATRTSRIDHHVDAMNQPCDQLQRGRDAYVADSVRQIEGAAEQAASTGPRRVRRG